MFGRQRPELPMLGPDKVLEIRASMKIFLEKESPSFKKDSRYYRKNPKEFFESGILEKMFTFLKEESKVLPSIVGFQNFQQRALETYQLYGI